MASNPGRSVWFAPLLAAALAASLFACGVEKGTPGDGSETSNVSSELRRKNPPQPPPPSPQDPIPVGLRSNLDGGVSADAGTPP